MVVEVIDGRALDDAAAAEIAEVANAAGRIDAPQNEPQSGEYIRLSLRHGWDDLGTENVVVGRVDGTLAAFASVELPVWDNLHMAFVELVIAPGYRGSGIGDRVLDQVYAIMRANDRALLIANAWKGSDLERFWLDHGLEMGSAAAQRRLHPLDLDWSHLDRLHAESLAASTAYEVVQVTHPVSDDLVEGMVQLQLVMNDAPIDGLSIDDDVWNAKRYRAAEAATANRRMTSYGLVARHRDSGDLAGFTAVVVEDERPHLGFQEDTAVVRAHRGHRLGVRLKIEMLRRLREAEPQIVQIDTWNAVSNSHMIAVNEAMGCVVVGYGGELARGTWADSYRLRLGAPTWLWLGAVVGVGGWCCRSASRPELAFEPLFGLVDRAFVRTGRQVLPAAVGDHERDVGWLAGPHALVAWARAACRIAPVEMPAKIPSSSSSSRVRRTASRGPTENRASIRLSS